MKSLYYFLLWLCYPSRVWITWNNPNGVPYGATGYQIRWIDCLHFNNRDAIITTILRDSAWYWIGMNRIRANDARKTIGEIYADKE